MNIFQNLNHQLLTIPAPVRVFLKKALFIFILWKLVYHLVLFPARFPDRQLTLVTAYTTAFLYKEILAEPMIFSREEYRPDFPRTSLYIKDRKVIGIADPCNGLELYVLYIAFLFCFTTTWSKKIKFVSTGVAVIFIANSLRCLGLAWLFMNRYSFADFAHHYFFKMIIYAMIFYMWVQYSKKTF